MNGVRWPVATAALLAAALVAGCSARSVSTGVSDVVDWIGSKAEVAYFVGVDDLALRDGPKLSAKLVGHLTLHQEVLRSTVENGYARVRVPDGSLHGWVINRKLLRKLPSDQITQ